MQKIFAAICLLFASSVAIAAGLPAPSRTVYKCEEGKKVYYSDAPCIGAQKIDIQPTRGLNKSSGRELMGADVQRERTREQVAEAIRPITGLNAKQLDQFGRRTKLSQEAQQQCRTLDQSIPMAEVREREAHDQQSLKVAQMDLFNLRKRFHEHACE